MPGARPRSGGGHRLDLARLRTEEAFRVLCPATDPHPRHAYPAPRARAHPGTTPPPKTSFAPGPSRGSSRSHTRVPSRLTFSRPRASPLPERPSCSWGPLPRGIPNLPHHPNALRRSILARTAPLSPKSLSNPRHLNPCSTQVGLTSPVVTRLSPSHLGASSPPSSPNLFPCWLALFRETTNLPLH